MSKFNLEQALQGAPVKLQGGYKAYVKNVVPSEYIEDQSELHGVVADGEYDGAFIWHLNGSYFFATEQSKFDIIGMWED